MKRLLICLLTVFLVNNGFAQKNHIGYIESDKNWHYIYDAQGKKLGGFSRSSVGEVVGWGTDFFVGKQHSFYRIYDIKGKVLKALSINTVGEVLSVSGDTITSRLGNWIYFWDKNGKKIGSRPAS
jgi:hypothetical protein